MGAGFTPQTTASLQLVGNPAWRDQVQFVDANHLDATFDLTGAPIGNYVLQISDSGKTSSGTDLISVAAGTGFPYGGAVSISCFLRQRSTSEQASR